MTGAWKYRLTKVPADGTETAVQIAEHVAHGWLLSDERIDGDGQVILIFRRSAMIHRSPVELFGPTTPGEFDQSIDG